VECEVRSEESADQFSTRGLLIPHSPFRILHSRYVTTFQYPFIPIKSRRTTIDDKYRA
jgi:hypothetical protein